MITVAGPSDLIDLPLPEPGARLPGRPVDDPLLLVCTHGRRDRCCALDGRALVRALVEAGEPDVWECSHLSGHRFAPTALVLPIRERVGAPHPATCGLAALPVAWLEAVAVTPIAARLAAT
ncbi:MAG: hypothetical protein JOY78_20875 [Pseudonocardia sp.]|nr:hypothetical protein [Pseudonocardia sp.]